MKRIAVIDLGTNTFHLLITDIDDPVVPGNVCKKTIAVKLGQGGINQGVIHPEAYHRGIKAIEEFSGLINFHEVSAVKAVATAAIRSASNGSHFISEIREKTGIQIEMIDGEREAELIYKGVREVGKLGGKPSLIMDIGGGSTEFILCDENDVIWKRSYPIGAAKMMDRFHHSDPISQEDVSDFTKHLDDTLGDLMEECRRYRPAKLIGSAGAFETFTELINRHFQPDNIMGGEPAKEINLEYFHEIAATLRTSTHDQRTQMPGLITLRVDMIVIATILTEYIINKLEIESVMLSDYSLKEGMLFDLISSSS
jgi:exopolyphosphatase / guanosine-5'-triphosphate,3'-diphosphate pyrophosphatase